MKRALSISGLLLVMDHADRTAPRSAYVSIHRFPAKPLNALAVTQLDSSELL